MQKDAQPAIHCIARSDAANFLRDRAGQGIVLQAQVHQVGDLSQLSGYWPTQVIVVEQELVKLDQIGDLWKDGAIQLLLGSFNKTTWTAASYGCRSRHRTSCRGLQRSSSSYCRLIRAVGRIIERLQGVFTWGSAVGLRAETDQSAKKIPARHETTTIAKTK